MPETTTTNTTTALAVGSSPGSPSSPGTGLSIYDRVDPMAFINEMGLVFSRTNAGGAKTDSDGKLLALACLSRRVDVFELTRDYHLMDGKLVTKAETMLARIHLAGWTSEWINDGSDGKIATLELTSPKGKSSRYTFTIETAKQAGYVRSGSNWTKRPDQQLRARCITDLARMRCPELIHGDVAYEEAIDLPPVVIAAASTPTQPQRTAEQVAARQRELQATATVTANSDGGGVTQQVQQSTPQQQTSTTAPALADPVIEAEIEPVSAATATTTTDSPTTQTQAPPHQHQAAIMEIELVAGSIGVTLPQLIGSINKKRAAAGESEIKELGELAEDKLQTILSNLQAAVAKKQDAANQAAMPQK